jgi:hypothetical protein
VTQEAPTDPRADRQWFSFRSWLARQVDRTDRVGRIAQAVADGKVSISGAPASTGHEPFSVHEARIEFNRWYDREWPNSPAAHAMRAKFKPNGHRPVDRAIPDVDRFDGDIGRALLLVAEVQAGQSELVEELLQRLDVDSVRMNRLRSMQRTIDGQIAALRRAARGTTSNGTG